MSKRTRKVVRRATKAIAIAASVLAADAVAAIVGRALTRAADRRLGGGGKKSKKKRKGR
jgi:hypothetical protein